MTAQAENTRRIAKNTLMLYVRMLFSMIVSLYTSRVVLNMLGVEDYGIYNVVGGLVAMFSIINGSLSAASGRFLAFELGREDKSRIRKVFSTSFSIHVGLGMVCLVLLETFGLWFLNTQMDIPEGRMIAANWLFQISVFTFMLGLIGVPFAGVIVAHERMGAFSAFGILTVLLNLVVVVFLAYSPCSFDRLIAYALLLAVVAASVQFITMGYCLHHFEECSLRLCIDKSCMKEISAFTGWNFIGSTSALLKDQGVNLLLNLFFGTVINAARGIAVAVNSAVCSFANNFMAAINPQITKAYASGDKGYVMSLVERGSRFSFYIILFFALPIFIETDFVLALWLGSYPCHTVNFVRLILLFSLSEMLSKTLITLILATGDIRDSSIVVGLMQMMIFPLAYICLKIGYSPESTMIVTIVISVVNMFLRLYFLRRIAGISIRQYLQNVCVNVLTVLLAAAVLPAVTAIVLPEGWWRFVVVVAISVCSVGASAYYIGCSGGERRFILASVVSAKKRFLG